MIPLVTEALASLKPGAEQAVGDQQEHQAAGYRCQPVLPAQHGSSSSLEFTTAVTTRRGRLTSRSAKMIFIPYKLSYTQRPCG